MINRGNTSRGLYLPRTTSPRNKPPKIHYITYHGGEFGREALLHDTVEWTLPFVDTLTVVCNREETSGANRKRKQWGDNYREVNYAPRSGLIGDSIYLAIMESGAVEGDWVVWHDSDERLSADTLPKLRQILEAVPRNYAEVLSAEILHNPDDKLNPVVKSKPSHRHIFRYSPKVVVQMDGGHCRILTGPSEKLKHDLVRFNHYKWEESIAQSTFLHCLSSPAYHRWEEPYLSEWNATKATLRHHYDIRDFSLMSLVELSQNTMNLKPIDNLMEGWRSADWTQARRMAEFWLEYRFSFPVVNKLCSGDCCDYVNLVF